MTYEDQIIEAIVRFEKKLEIADKKTKDELLNKKIDDRKLLGFLNNYSNREIKEIYGIDLFDIKEFLLNQKLCKGCTVANLKCNKYAKVYLSANPEGRLFLEKRICINYLHHYYTWEVRTFISLAKDEKRAMKFLNTKFRLKIKESETDKFLETYLHGVDFYTKQKVFEYIKG